MNYQRGVVRGAVIAVAILLLEGCSAVAKFEGVQPGTTLSVRGMEPVKLPWEVKMDSKSTGQHEFMATAPGSQTMYGIIPLRVNATSLTASIMFFAPALFIGGFRDAFPFYQFDLEAGIVRFKLNEGDAWREYRPMAAEGDRAKQYFGGAGTPK
jgi:hypothetical protein